MRGTWVHAKSDHHSALTFSPLCWSQTGSDHVVASYSVSVQLDLLDATYSWLPGGGAEDGPDLELNGR